MKSTGIVRGIDALGRIVLPKELRLSFAGGTENPYAYSLRLKKGRFVRDGQGLRCLPEDGEIILLAR